jgi:hypothetical protein
MDRLCISPEVASLVHSSHFDLLLFQLDDTLVGSGRLERFRDPGNVGNQSEKYRLSLWAEAQALTHMIPETVLLQIRQTWPVLRLGVITSAPRIYARILLGACYPNIRWDCLEAFENFPAGCSMPNPAGVFRAARAAGVDDLSRTALVSSDAPDLIAAFQAGAHAVLFTSGRNGRNRSRQARARDLFPDAELSDPAELMQLISQSDRFLPALEAWLHGATCAEEPLRVGVTRHFSAGLREAGTGWVDAYSMARYFRSGRYSYQSREHENCVRAGILAAKDGIPYPDAWADCCAAYILQYSKKLGRPLVVCTVPSANSRCPAGRHRLFELSGRLRDRLHQHPRILLQGDVLKYTGETKQNKMLDRANRFRNVREHLHIGDNSSVRNSAVLVLDDVATTGATFFHATRILLNEGALSVHCLALAQTIS